MSKINKKKTIQYYAGIGMIFGGGIGLIFGLAIFSEVALGLVFGSGIGMALGAAFGKSLVKKTDSND